MLYFIYAVFYLVVMILEKNNKTDKKDRAPLADDLVIGRNAVIEHLKSGADTECVYVAKGEREGSIVRVLSLCSEKKITVKYVDRKKLDYMAPGGNHQGVIASVPAHSYSTVAEILQYARDKGEAPFLLLCDGIEDSHNLGALIRTAEACGVHGVIIPKRRSVGLNYIVAKTSCGALEYMRVAKVTNLTAAIEELKAQNIWVYAADMDGQVWCKTDFSGGAALVVGSEGSGVSRLVKSHCDGVVSLPMLGHVGSLNASVAAGIILYEIARQRLGLSGGAK